MKRILWILDRTLNNISRPLGDKTGVGAKDKVQKDMRRRSGKKTLGFVILDRDHQMSQPPPAIAEARAVRI